MEDIQLNNMLRFLYYRYRRRFHDFFLEDLLNDIPKEVSDVGIEMVGKNRELFTKFLYYHAHTIHRRDPTDFVNIERKMGILTQIKLMLILIGNAPRGEEPHPVVGTTVSVPKDFKDEIENFKKGKIISKK